MRAAALSRTERFWALLLALVWDLSLGEPPEAAHPVVWMGRAIDAADRRAPEEERPRLAYGALVALALPLIAAAVTRTALAVTRPPLLRLALTAYLLKSSLSVRGLLDAARRVQASLEADDLAGARDALRALVSRETGDLSSELVASAAIESLAENLTDSLAGPLVAYAVGGLPAAVAYRMVNTADAMLGYRSERYEHLGKAAARLDDVANLLPARVAALALVAASVVSGYSPAEAWRGAWQGRQATASPNAGWTIGAMAGALGVVLEKVGHYRLGIAKRPVTPAIIREAATLVGRAAALLSVSILLLEAWRSARNRQS